MKISIYMLTMGRWDYVRKALESIEYADRFDDIEIRIDLCCQGVKPPPGFSRENYLTLALKIHEWPENIGIAAGMNRIIPDLDGDLIMKMDEDCKIVSNDFFLHVAEIHKLMPYICFSPYPVGLINNPGGVRGLSHEVIWSKDLDQYYTLRDVDHLGGFARIMPAYFAKKFILQPDLGIPGASGNEDGQISKFLNSMGIRMAYLENAIVVEHQESTLGQHARYGDTYFKGRF